MNSYYLIIYVVAFIAIFYFMAIRPQQRQRKAHQSLLESLKKGDSIIMASGMYGKVKRVEDNMVVVEIAKGVNIKIARRAVAEILRDPAEARRVAPEGPTASRGKRGQAAEDDVWADNSDSTESSDENGQDSES